MADDPALTAETDGGNRERVKTRLRRALNRAGAILPDSMLEALTDVAVEEMADVRRRMARMMECYAEMYGSDPRLEAFVEVLWMHRRDENNLGYLPAEMLPKED